MDHLFPYFADLGKNYWQRPNSIAYKFSCRGKKKRFAYRHGIKFKG